MSMFLIALTFFTAAGCGTGFVVESTTTAQMRPMWNEWGSWLCQVHTWNGTCLMSRTRNCSTHQVEDCRRTYSTEFFEVRTCSKDICKVTPSTPAYCSLYDSSKDVCRDVKGCSDFTLAASIICKEPREARGCPVLCKCCVPATSVTTEPTTILTTTTLRPPEPWNPWGGWRCLTVDHGLCMMIRLRTCSTGKTEDCGHLADQREINPCDKSICPEMYALQLSGKCGHYYGHQSNCNAESHSCAHLDTNSDACDNIDVASTICPKKCGCCDNTIDGVNPWQPWSPWRCDILLGPHSECIMTRHRVCPSGRQHTCIGESYENIPCEQHACTDTTLIHVNCSQYDSSKAGGCEDSSICSTFYDYPSELCSDVVLTALCPSFCGCCNSTPAILPSTTSFPVPINATSLFTGTDAPKITTTTIPLPTETPTTILPPTERPITIPLTTKALTTIPAPTETTTTLPPPKETTTTIPPPSETTTIPLSTETTTTISPPTETTATIPPPIETTTTLPLSTETTTMLASTKAALTTQYFTNTKTSITIPMLTAATDTISQSLGTNSSTRISISTTQPTSSTSIIGKTTGHPGYDCTAYDSITAECKDANGCTWPDLICPKADAAAICPVLCNCC